MAPAAADSDAEAAAGVQSPVADFAPAIIAPEPDRTAAPPPPPSSRNPPVPVEGVDSGNAAARKTAWNVPAPPPDAAAGHGMLGGAASWPALAESARSSLKSSSSDSLKSLSDSSFLSPPEDLFLSAPPQPLPPVANAVTSSPNPSSTSPPPNAAVASSQQNGSSNQPNPSRRGGGSNGNGNNGSGGSSSNCGGRGTSGSSSGNSSGGGGGNWNNGGHTSGGGCNGGSNVNNNGRGDGSSNGNGSGDDSSGNGGGGSSWTSSGRGAGGNGSGSGSSRNGSGGSHWNNGSRGGGSSSNGFGGRGGFRNRRDHERGGNSSPRNPFRMSPALHLQQQQGYQPGQFTRPPPPPHAHFVMPQQFVPYNSPFAYPDVHPYPVYFPPLEQFRNMQLVPQPMQHIWVPTVGDPNLQQEIRAQIEFYFSTANLCHDIFLRTHMNDQGWVPLTLITGFNRMRRFTNLVDINYILDAVRGSEILEVQGTNIRRRNDWENWLLPRGPAPANQP